MNKVQTLIYHYFNFTFSTKKRNKINNLLKDRHYPDPFIYGPEEISRYIIDFINPIHKPPSKKLRWKRQTKKNGASFAENTEFPEKSFAMCVTNLFTGIVQNVIMQLLATNVDPDRFPLAAQTANSAINNDALPTAHGGDSLLNFREATHLSSNSGLH